MDLDKYSKCYCTLNYIYIRFPIFHPKISKIFFNFITILSTHHFLQLNLLLSSLFPSVTKLYVTNNISKANFLYLVFPNLCLMDFGFVQMTLAYIIIFIKHTIEHVNVRHIWPRKPV
jgi:hypothetical protein